MENKAEPPPSFLARYLPIVAWLPAYNRGWLSADAIAGLHAQNAWAHAARQWFEWLFKAVPITFFS